MYKYLRWTICSVRHGTQPSISVVITAQGGAETHCKGLLQHPSIVKIGSLNPLNNGGPTSATQPRKCTVWAVVSGTARNALPDQMARLYYTTTQRDEIAAAAQDPEIHFRIEARQHLAHATAEPPTTKPPLLNPPTRVQKLFKQSRSAESQSRHMQPPDHDTKPLEQQGLSPPPFEPRPPVQLSDTMLRMDLAGTGPFTNTGCAR
jgi:hypothetical protein